MKGIIFHVNNQREMYSVIVDGSFAIIHTSEKLNKGQIVYGDFDSLGYNTLKTINEEIECIVENLKCSETIARAQCFINS